MRGLPYGLFAPLLLLSYVASSSRLVSLLAVVSTKSVSFVQFNLQEFVRTCVTEKTFPTGPV